MAYIESLTPEQEAQIPEYYEKWLKIGLSTERGNHACAARSIDKVYSLQGFTAPRVVLWADSPPAGARLAALLAREKNGIKNPSVKRIQSMVEIGPDNAEPTKEEINAQLQWGKLGFGQQDAHWLGYYDYFMNVVEVEGLEKAQGLIELAADVCWFWTFQYAAILVEKPVRLEIDEEGRLHSHSGMAIQFPDGFGIYQHHGITVTEQLIMHPETLTTEQIFAEQNAEVRRAMIERLTYEKFFALASPKVLDADKDELGYDRRLLRVDLVDDEPVTVIELTNSTPEPDGSFHMYYIRVHPELRPMLFDGTLGDPQQLTCQNAVASTHGLVGKEYVLAVQT